MKAFQLFAVVCLLFSASCNTVGKASPDAPKKAPGTALALTDQSNDIGMNTWYLCDWDGSNAFVDLMKHGRPWKDPDWKSEIPADKDGWPLGDCSTVLFAGEVVRARDFNGVYQLSFEGQADVSPLWVNAVVSNMAYDAASNTTCCEMRYYIDDHATGGIVFRNTKRTAESPVNSGIRNIRIIRPGYPKHGSKVFTDPFVKAFDQIHLVRAMEWLSINANATVEWKERTKPSYAFAAAPLADRKVTYPAPLTLGGLSAGVALEYLVSLCNETDADLWINVPTLANDEYVTKLAKLIQYGSDGVNPYSSHQKNPVYPPLKPHLRVYVEYSNEIWNTAWGFRSFYLLQDLIHGLPADHPLFLGGLSLPADQYTALYRYPAYRLGAISDLFRKVFGEGAMISRIRPILSAQRGNANMTLSSALVWADEYYRKLQGREINTLFYGAGGSAYYDVNVDAGDIEKFFDPSNAPDLNFMRFNQIDSTWAYAYGLKRVAYEGGLGLDIFKPDGSLLFSPAQQQQIDDDPRVQDLVEKNHIAWSQSGGDLMVYYCLTGPESWKFTNSLSGPTSPKLVGLRNIMAAPKAAVTMGGALPGTLVARQLYSQPSLQIRTGYGWDASIDGLPVVSGNKTGNLLALPGHAARGFSGQLTLRGEGEAGKGASLGIWVNGTKAGVVVLPGSAGLKDTEAIPVAIPQGLVVLRIEVESGSYSLRSVTISE